MRDFTWNYFTMTGDVESYLLYKEIHSDEAANEDFEQDLMDIEEDE